MNRPEQAILTKDNDLTKTDETLDVIDSMVDGLNDHDIENMGRFFAESFRWMGNAGCGFKDGLEEFQKHWQKPFQAAFSNKICVDEARITQGQWCAAFGRQEAIHSGKFMGIEATGKKVIIRYMDFWKVVDGKIVDNYVTVDFPSIMMQLGVDPFSGNGWENMDSVAGPLTHSDEVM